MSSSLDRQEAVLKQSALESSCIGRTGHQLSLANGGFRASDLPVRAPFATGRLITRRKALEGGHTPGRLRRRARHLLDRAGLKTDERHAAVTLIQRFGSAANLMKQP